MSFVIGKVTTVKKKVSWTMPASEGVKPVKCDVVVEFKLRTTSEIRERHEKLQEYIEQYTRYTALVQKFPDEEHERPQGGFDEEYLYEDIVDISGILDEQDNEVPFSADVLAQVLDVKEAKAAIMDTWNEINLKDPTGKRGNSRKRGGTG